MSTLNCQFIVYACPVGELNIQLEDYLEQSRQLWGENMAHKYMPHCTLTGFFTDELSSIPIYLQALDQVYVQAQSDRFPLNIEIQQLTFNDNWHGLELKADGLKQLIADFYQVENSPTRQEALRLKDWLHLSLAYGFNLEHGEQLKQLAIEIINIKSDVYWELRFYQRNQDWTWNNLKSWQLN